MKLLVVLTSLALALSACGKANDLPAIKAETEGLITNYQARIEALVRRGDAIIQRGNAVGVTSPDAANASRLFQTSRGRLEQLRTELRDAPRAIAGAKDALAMRRIFDTWEQKLEAGYVEINADFDAIESWITLAESRPAQVSARTQPVVPAPTGGTPEPAPNAPPPPGNPGEHGAGGTRPNAPR